MVIENDFCDGLFEIRRLKQSRRVQRGAVRMAGFFADLFFDCLKNKNVVIPSRRFDISR